MQPLPYEPKTPDQFAELMVEIWGGDCLPGEDGSTICFMSELYHDWADAIKVAKEIGLVRTGGSTRDGNSGNIYRFPAGDGIWINSNGSVVIPKCARFTRRKL